MELFAIIGEVHEVDVAIGREHDKMAKILSIFISLWGAGRQGVSMLEVADTQKFTRFLFVLPSP